MLHLSDSYAWKSISGVIVMFVSGLLNVEGVWVWKPSFSGLYTVKSGYTVAYRWRLSKEAGVREGSNWVGNEVRWNRFWSAKSADDMKLLFWRVFHNAIPVRLNLAKWGVEGSLEFPVCGYKVKCTDHLFLGCWWVRGLWEALGMVTSSLLDNIKVSDWLWDALSSSSKEEVSKIIIGLHMVWSNRNQVVHGKRMWNVVMCAFKVECSLAEFSQIRVIGVREDLLGADIA